MATTSFPQRFATVFGGVYVLVGAMGFLVTGGVDVAQSQGDDLILFEVNPLHNVVHLAVGALLLGGALGGDRAARAVSALVGSVYLLVATLGFFAVGKTWNILAVNQADNLLHLATAAVALGVVAGAGGPASSWGRRSRHGARWPIGAKPGPGRYRCTLPDSDWEVTLDDHASSLPPCASCPPGTDVEYERV